MIKKVLLISLLMGSAVMAETKMEYKISLIGMNMDYREYDSSGNIFDSEKSSYSDITGSEFEYSYFLDRNSHIDLNVMGVMGDTEYVGAYLGSEDGYGSVVSTTSNTIYDVSLGYNTKNMSDINIMFLGGIGVGYRYWQRELSASQIEEYYWYSLRANAGMQFKYSDITTSIIAEYQYGIDPKMRATGIAEDFELSSANIVKISVPIRYTVNQYFDFTCAYVFEYQKIEESNVVYDSTATGYVEPDSKAYNQYIKVGMVFKY
jgi:hypothetical protein